MTNGGGTAEEEPQRGAEPAPLARDEALRNIEGSRREVTNTKDATTPPDPAASDIGARTLSHLTRLHPLMSFFCWVADRQFPATLADDVRVARLRRKDPRFYWTCVVIDVAVTTAAAVALLAAACAAAYKTIVL
ncbi:MAG TPA: hypothetical protein VFQ85_02885 [Mycobacteriales bacterium]|jgi:hypothetical protein|nr:hypothetical protein [Mycobacteriales bacterium]